MVRQRFFIFWSIMFAACGMLSASMEEREQLVSRHKVMLEQAVRDNAADTVSRIIHMSIFEYRNYWGVLCAPAFCLAIELGHSRIVDIFLAHHCADYLTRESRLLDILCRDEHVDILKRIHTQIPHSALIYTALRAHKFEELQYMERHGVEMDYEALLVHTAECGNMTAFRFLASGRQHLLSKINFEAALRAAEFGKIEFVRLFVEKFPEIIDGQAQFTGYTMLHYASRAKRADVVQYLLAQGARTDLLTKRGRKKTAFDLAPNKTIKALFAAPQREQRPMAPEVLQANNVPDSPALERRDRVDASANQILDLTHDSGSENSSSDSDSPHRESGIIRCMSLVRANDVEAVKRLLKSNSVGLESVFYEALMHGNLELVKYCVCAGVNKDLIYVESCQGKKVPLLVAIESSNSAIVRELLNASAELKDRYVFSGGYTEWPTLYCAVRYQDFETVRYLVNHGLRVAGMKWGAHSPLNVAAEKGDIAMIRFLVDNGIDMAQSRKYRTAAHEAAAAGKLTALDYVLTLRPGWAKQKYSSYTPLYKAASAGHLDCVKLLVEKYKVPLDEHISKSKYTPLIIAARNGHADVVRYLIATGAQQDKKNARGETALDCARCMKRDDIVELLSSSEPVRALGSQNVQASPEPQDSEGNEPRAQEGENSGQHDNQMQQDEHVDPQNREQNVEAGPAQASGAEQHKSIRENGVWSTFMQYITNGDVVSVVRLLPQHKALAKKSDSRGYTLLHHAARHGNRTLCSMLMGVGARAEHKDNAGYSTMHYATLSGKEALIKDLLDRNLSVQAEGKDGKTSFLLAVQCGYGHIVSLFLATMTAEEKMVALNQPTTQGVLPLHEAAKGGGDAIGSTLIANGAFVSSYDIGGATALHYAVAGGHTEMIRVLLGNGACRQAQDKDKRIPLEIAQANGNHELINLLRVRDRADAEPEAKRQKR